MVDYIDRQAAMEAVCKCTNYFIGNLPTMINKDDACKALSKLPSVDAVEVVRCKDCRWYKTNFMWNGTEVKICAKEAYEPSRNADDFCSYGERKDG